jgi:hypothetical protein
MCKSPPSARSLFTASAKRRLACTVLLAYLALLLQPCAMAMNHAPDQHNDTCHQEFTLSEDSGCLSQPASDCATDKSVIDWQNPWGTDSDVQLVSLLHPVSILAVETSSSELRYFSRAPPPGSPALNLRHCVFLK